MPCDAIVNQTAVIKEAALIANLNDKIVETVLRAIIQPRLRNTAAAGRQMTVVKAGDLVSFEVPGFLGSIDINLKTGRVTVGGPIFRQAGVTPRMVIDLLKPAARQVIAYKVKNAITQMGGAATIETKAQYSQIRARIGGGS